MHHWKGSVYIPGVTVVQAVDLSNAYEEYPSIYQPVLTSALLARDGNTCRVRLRLRESAGGLSAVLDVTSRVQYLFPNPGTAFSMSTSEEIREVERPGTAGERQLPIGHDSGYLWRATTLNRLTKLNDGVFVEMETIGLSRVVSAAPWLDYRADRPPPRPQKRRDSPSSSSAMPSSQEIAAIQRCPLPSPTDPPAGSARSQLNDATESRTFILLAEVAERRPLNRIVSRTK